MEEKDYNYKKQPVTVCNADGEFHFESYEEYKKWEIRRRQNMPILCNTCIYHCQDEKKCPISGENKAVGCSYYTWNPTNLKKWSRYYWQTFRQKLFNKCYALAEKYKIGHAALKRKSWIFLPSIKYPFFTGFRRIRNEYYNEGYVWKFGFLPNDNREGSKNRFFEKYYTDNLPGGTHINYEEAECLEDCYVQSVNNIKAHGGYFKCIKGQTYCARKIEKYKYYDICYQSDDVHITGQLSFDEFDKHFRYISLNEKLDEYEKTHKEDIEKWKAAQKEHEEYIQKLVEEVKREENEQQHKEQPKKQSSAVN